MKPEEMQIAVCEKLPELIEYHAAACPCVVCTVCLTEKEDKHFWKKTGEIVNWPTEGLQVCHEAEKLLGEKLLRSYAFILAQVLDTHPTVDLDDQFLNIHATTEQRLEALCRVWFPERFK